ncbi:MAG: hypothetical protein DIJKHBIC_00476 [Thermoanaerobaculia bacterium]|nr:hypothetical protein [Thermoanaerobaculia bacterium]
MASPTLRIPTFRLLAALVLLSLPTVARSADYFVVSTPNSEARDRARATNDVVNDYGSFLLVRGKAASFPGDSTPVKKTIEIRGVSFDPLVEASQPARNTRAALAAPGTDAALLHLVQFIGPVTDDWRQEVEKQGVEFLQYVPHNSFIVRASLAQIGNAGGLSFVRATAPYGGPLKLAPAIREALQAGSRGVRAVDIMVTSGTSASAAAGLVTSAGGSVRASIALPSSFFRIVRAEIPMDAIADIAASPLVLGIDPYVPPAREDERAAQIVAGNYSSSTVLSGPGYNPMAQFGADGTGVTVAVVDDGIGIPGDGGFYVTAANAADAALREAAAGADGHGHLNASIIAGTTPYAPNLDGLGYNYGSGVAPKANVTNIPLLRDGYSGTEANTANDAVVTPGPNGVPGFISSNSWGAGTNANAYDSLAAQYDGFVRDASAASSIDPLLIIFSAGNSGASGLTRPKVAKNVVSVAAGENIRPELSPYGGNPNDNMDEISSYSSRGLAADGRIKPDLAAPGTAVTGGRSGPDTLFGNIDTYHRWSTGTSHACPQVSGAAALIVQWWKSGHGGANPSPALVKAALINGTVPMAAGTAGGPIPNGAQGWGRVNLKKILNTGLAMTHLDQESVLDSPGLSSSVSGAVGNSLAPFRVTLVWTDPPGISDPALVNDLDLEVTVGGVTYKGNVMSGGISVTGGSADTLNNVENVFLPAGIAAGTPYTAKVTARALNGDGIPGNADVTDQNFALVISNGSSCPAPPSTITAPPHVCKSSTGNTATVASGADSYVWTITNGAITAGQGSPSVTFSATGSSPVELGVTVTKNSCSSASAISIPVITAAISAPAATCASSTGNTASALPGGSLYTWTITNGTITAGQGTNSITFSAGASGNVTLGLSLTYGACTDSSTVNIPINQSGSLTITAPASVCSTSTNNSASVSGASAPYTWSITNGSIVAGQGTASITFSAGTTGPVGLAVTATQGSCTYTGSRSVPVNGTPQATITAPAAACPNATGLIATAPVGADTYAWSILNGTILSGQSTRQITFSVGFSGSTVLSLSVTAGGCAGSSTKDIPVSPPAAPPAALIPANGATGFTGGFISWSHTGSVPFDVFLDTAASPERRLGTTASNSLGLPVWFPSTTYYWKVAAKEACGDVSSPVFSFTTGTCPWTGTAPVLSGPLDNATGVSASNVVLTWQAVPGAAYYVVHLSTAASPSAYRTITVPQTSTTLSLNPGTQWNWRITAFPVCGTGAAVSSPVRTFRTGAGGSGIGSVTPSTLNRWMGGTLQIAGSGLLNKTFKLDREGQGGGAFSPATATATLVTGSVAASPLSPSGSYDLVMLENGAEKLRVPAAVSLRAFTDVTEADYFFLSSARIADAAIMESDSDPGLAGPQFSPTTVLTRAKVAEYLAKAYQWWRTRSVTPPPATCVSQGTGSADFPDVPCDHPQWLSIHWIKAWGVTVGAPCPEGLCFFPSNSLTRAEMVTFLERLKQGGLLNSLLASVGETDPGCSQPYPACSGWEDPGLKVATWPRREANVAFADRQTKGCAGAPGSGLSFCPFEPVDRAQMAEFLARTIGLIPNP